MEASQNLKTPPKFINTPANFMKDDDVSEECKNLISSLPTSENDFTGKKLYNYQGSWYYPNTIQAILNFQKHFRPRDSDIILASLPKSGTTWLKALVFAVVHRNKYAPNLVSHPLLSNNPHNLVRFLEVDLYVKNQCPGLEELPSPRIFATHVPFQRLHESLRDSPCKVVYVCRNIKDALVSRWHFRSKIVSNYLLEDMINEYIKGAYFFGPIEEQILSYWKESLVNSNLVLFMRYEEMIEKPVAQVMRLADFLGCSFSEEEKQSGMVEKILELCSLGNLSNLEANKIGTSTCGIAHHAFFRKGGVGDWKNHLTDEMARKLDEMVEKKLEGSGLWRKEKRDFLQSLSRISMLPKTNMIDASREANAGQLVPVASSTRGVSSTLGKELVALANIPIHEKKTYVYGEAVKKLNMSRERGLPFKPAMSFKEAYESLGAEGTHGKSVNIQKIWQLVQAITGEDSAVRQGVSKRMSLAIGARRHLERGHEKHIMDTIQTHPTQAALGGSVGNLQRIRAFLRIRLREYGVLDFDSPDARRQPPVDTTWQQIYFCLRTGYYEEAKEIARSTRSSQQFAPLLTEWITKDGMVAAETAAIASEECEKMLRMGDRLGRTAYDKKKLLLYTIISGSRRQIERILRDLSTLFNTIEDFLWFKLACIKDVSGASSSSVVLNDGLAPYSLDDLQTYLNKFEPSYYTKNGKDPLVYPYVLLLSVQLLPAIMHLSKEAGEGGYNIDAVHIAISLVDHSVLSEGSGTGHKLSVMDANAEASSMVRQYGSMFLHHGDLQMTVEYYAQAAVTVGGGQLAWSGRSNTDQQRQRNLMLKQLLTEILLREGGIYFLLGGRGSGEEGQLGRFFPDSRLRQQFLIEAAHQCQEAGLYDKSIEIQKRVGAFASALETINKCLSEAICSLARGRLDGESRTSGLILAGNDILQTYKYYPEVSLQEGERVMEQETILRELEAILSIHKLARQGNHMDALREIAKLPFLNLDPRVPDATADVFQSASPYFQTCVPDLLKVALTCLDNVPDPDGSIRAMRSKIAGFLASNTHRNWPRDLYEKVARSF